MNSKEKVKKSLFQLARLLKVRTEKGTWIKGLATALGFNENRIYSWINKGNIPDGAILEIEQKGYPALKWLVEEWVEHVSRIDLTHQQIAAISERVVNLMEDMGWNRQQLYSRTNINPKRADHFYVLGEFPRPRHIEIIAEKTGYNKNWLWGGQGPRMQREVQPNKASVGDHPGPGEPLMAGPEIEWYTDVLRQILMQGDAGIRITAQMVIRECYDKLKQEKELQETIHTLEEDVNILKKSLASHVKSAPKEE